MAALFASTAFVGLCYRRALLVTVIRRHVLAHPVGSFQEGLLFSHSAAERIRPVQRGPSSPAALGGLRLVRQLPRTTRIQSWVCKAALVVVCPAP